MITMQTPITLCGLELEADVTYSYCPGEKGASDCPSSPASVTVESIRVNVISLTGDRDVPQELTIDEIPQGTMAKIKSECLEHAEDLIADRKAEARGGR